MSTVPDSIPSAGRSSRGGTSGSSSNRRGGSTSARGGGGGRRANFGGSLTGSSNDASNSSSNTNTKNNSKARSNQSRPPRLPRNQHAQASKQDDASVEDQSSAPSAATTESATAAAPTASANKDDDEDELPPEGELCFICADPIKLTSVAPCDHRTCHICALRLRVLYKKDECTFCKSKIDRLIFTSSSTKNFADFKPSDIPYTDKKLPISFETKEALEETVLLLRFNCPEPNCEVACTGWKDYKAHVRREHNRLVCQLCITNKKIFAHEHTLHTEQSLAAHERAEHRLCEYDRLWFYSDDELFAHMRDRHEQCHICKARGSEEERWKYYRDYDMLEKHFRRDHWLCENKSCLSNKFIVFDSEMDYKAHQLQEHGNELSTKERREALRIEANFSYDDGAESSRAGASRGGNNAANKKAKGRANGASAENAAQENRDVLGVSALASRSHVPGAGPANHASRRAMFGSGLTQPPAPQGVSADRPRTVNDSRSIEERHQAYMDKVASTLQSEQRVTSFRHSVRAFKNGESSARDLLSTMHSLVGGEMDDCAPLVNGLVDLLDDKDKSKALGDAWNQFRIERTQFPSLVPNAAGGSVSGIASGSGYAGAGSRGGAGNSLRSIKKSSAASSSQVWDNVERAASASSGHGAGKPVALREHFPSLGTPSSSHGTPSIPGSLAHAVAHNAATRAGAPGAKWSAASPAVSAGASSVPRPFVARVHSAGTSGASRNVNTTSKAAFPSLPTNAAKASINAHKKALFANRSSGGLGSGKQSPGTSASATPAGGASGTSTPWQPTPGRIDDFPEMPSATGGGGLGNLNGLNEALLASQRPQDSSSAGGAGGGKKKKGKGVQVLSFGGVHRG